MYVFPGQGAGFPGMAAEPYRAEPVFRAELDRALEALRPWTDAPLRELLLDPGHPDLFERTEVAQPALFAVEYALASWWAAVGVRPAALVGHSVGEFTAACLAGIFSLADAARLVAARGRLMGRLPAGSMLAVPLPESEVRALIGDGPGPDGLDLSAVNAPDRCVVAGTPEAVAELRERLAAWAWRPACSPPGTPSTPAMWTRSSASSPRWPPACRCTHPRCPWSLRSRAPG